MTLARRHHPNPVREQWARAQRWHARLKVADAADVADIALVVLHHAYTMHDWLIKALHGSNAPRYTQAEVERLFQSEVLRACRMMANAAKHLDLDARARAGVWDGYIVREYDPWTRSGRLTVLANGQHDLLELCDACMREVGDFIAGHNAAA